MAADDEIPQIQPAPVAQELPLPYTARTWPGRLDFGTMILCRVCNGKGGRGTSKKKASWCSACNGYGVVPNRGPVA